MSMALMAKAMSIKVGNPLRKLVLLKLADNANDQGECWPSYQHIADQCEIARSTVKSHIRELEKSGLLNREFRRDGELNKSNVFHLTLDGAADNRVGRQMPEGGAADARGGGAAENPRTSHSFEPVIEPINGTSANADEHTTSQPEKQKNQEQGTTATEKQKLKSNYQAVIDAFHKILPDMPVVREITEQRKTKIRNFFSKYKFNLADWKGYLEYIGQNCRWMFESRPRHRGANDESRWRPKTFDFLLTERCYLGVVEGTYDDVR